ncbi:MAG: hypothetical protein M3323_08315 [Actinomycetota bacterium]|nr:hypothetical protein [Actinomycetota bacterium]
MDTDRKWFRELFIEELAEITGGDPDIVSVRPLKDYLCAHHYTTLACGEETGPCAPSGC